MSDRTFFERLWNLVLDPEKYLKGPQQCFKGPDFKIMFRAFKILPRPIKLILGLQIQVLDFGNNDLDTQTGGAPRPFKTYVFLFIELFA